MSAQGWNRVPPQRIAAVTYIKHQGGGGSEAELIAGSDGKSYVVKFRGNPQGTRILANEYVTCQIAELLEAPCPPGRIMTVQAEFIGRVPIRYGGALAREGPQFASEFQCDDRGATFQAPVPSILKQLVNREKIAAKVILDNLVANEDAKIEHVIHHPVKGGQRFWEVDFGHTLGITRGWKGLVPPKPEAPLTAPCLAECIFDLAEFEPVLKLLDDRVTDGVLDEILSEVPLAEWEVGAEEPSSLKGFILQQKANMRNRIACSQKVFPKLGAK